MIDLVVWNLTSRCANRCAVCGVDKSHPQELPVERLLAVADELVELGVPEVIFAGGEPFLSPALPILLERLQGKLKTAAFTGGSTLPFAHVQRCLEAGLGRLTLSWDGASPAAQDLLRGRRGAGRELFTLADRIRARAPSFGLGVNTVVSRLNIASLEGIFAQIRTLQPYSWSATLVHDNLGRSGRPWLPSFEQLFALYTSSLPRLARLARAHGIEPRILPLPFSLLARGVPVESWDTLGPEAEAPLREDLRLIERGQANRTFLQHFACPLVRRYIALGPSGAVYPCSQAPAYRRSYEIGNVARSSLQTSLTGRACRSFTPGLRHKACLACHAPAHLNATSWQSWGKNRINLPS